MEGDNNVINKYTRVKYFNPLPPCGGRPLRNALDSNSSDFNPLPPCGGRLQIIDQNDNVIEISIHSLRVEGDRVDLWYGCQLYDFNPLPPCGGRPTQVEISKYDDSISIHSLRVEGDLSQQDRTDKVVDFNPLPPCGGRPWI